MLRSHMQDRPLNRPLGCRRLPGDSRGAAGAPLPQKAVRHRPQVLMKIVLLAVGPLIIAVGLFWFGQGVGLLPGPHNAVHIDAGAGVVAIGIGLVWFALR
jgi:hypothetical protein